MKLLIEVFEDSAVGFALVERTGEFRFVNKALCDILQYSKDEFLTLQWQEITYPEDLLKDLVMVKQVLDGFKKSYQLEKRYIRKDGSICYALLCVFAVIDKFGVFDCFCSQIIDTSAYVEMSKKIEDLITVKNRISQYQKEVLDGLIKNEFVLHYQEIINLKTLEVKGYEALIRWQHPTKGLVYPNDFIEICEQNPDVMLEVCRWVFNKACIDRPKLNGFLSINISPQSLLHYSFADMISTHNLRGDYPTVFLEITERVLVNLEGSKVLRKVEEKGCGFFIDDFGQANSGLVQVIQVIQSLKKESSVMVKMDIWFTRNIDSPITYASMKVLLALFREIGVDVIAEGIETETQLKAWQELGCNYGQGWLWGKAKPLN